MGCGSECTINKTVETIKKINNIELQRLVGEVV